MTSARARLLPLALEAGAELVRARLQVRLLSDRRLLSALGRPVTTVRDATDTSRARLVGSLVEKVARALPGTWSCLAQACAGQRMLTRRGLPDELHLGAGTRGGLMAHAWLTSSGVPVVGKPQGHAELVCLTRGPGT